MYTTTDLRRIFDLSRQTISNYAKEFADYLSPGATPAAGERRRFNDDDLAVFALIVSMRNASQDFESIHASLASGQRGETPNQSAVVRSTAQQIAVYQQQVKALEQQLQQAQLDTSHAQGERDALAKRLDEAQEQIIQLRIRLSQQD